MSLTIHIAPDVKAAIDKSSFNKDTSELIISRDGGGELRLQTPFRLNRVPDRVFDPSVDIAKVLIFRNRSFKEKSVIRLKYKVGEKNKACGFIFSLRGIMLPDDVVEDAHDKSLYAARALLELLQNRSSLPGKTPEFNSSGEYSLSDFYDDDIIVCIISKEQIGTYSTKFELALLYQLNLYGFYLLNGNNAEFQPKLNKYQNQAFDSIMSADNSADLLVLDLSDKVINEPYFESYIVGLINVQQNFLTKFFLIYQCYEILIDYVTKAEVSTKIGNPGALDGKSGYAIRGIVLEIGDEGFRIEKLFNHYSRFPFESDYHIGFEIHDFFSSYKPNYEQKPKASAGNHFYDLRNTIVHNLRMCYLGTQEEVKQKLYNLELIITHVEFLTIEIILGLKI
jgi:hypothetical protein